MSNRAECSNQGRCIAWENLYIVFEIERFPVLCLLLLQLFDIILLRKGYDCV